MGPEHGKQIPSRGTLTASVATTNVVAPARLLTDFLIAVGTDAGAKVIDAANRTISATANMRKTMSISSTITNCSSHMDPKYAQESRAWLLLSKQTGSLRLS